MLHATFLNEILILLATAVAVVAVFRRLKLSPVLGYFVAGSAIGSHALNLVQPAGFLIFGEFGIVFLLFAIGLEMTFDRLKSMRTHVFGFGTLQLCITTGVIAGIISMIYGIGSESAIVVGGGLALSSTAIVLQVIAEHRTQSTQVGRLAIATLIMQDFAVVPLLVLVPLLAQSNVVLANALVVSFGKALISLILIFIAGRLLLRPLFQMISSSNAAKSNELFIATTLLIALGAAHLTEALGLSLALGAFVAGVLVAETEYQHQAEESIAPFKGLLLGLFFMTVGMEIDVQLIFRELSTILLGSCALITIKALIMIGLCLAFRFSLGAAIHAGLLLAQGGEFAFVLFTIAGDVEILSPIIVQRLQLIVTVTMAFTPLLSSIGSYFADHLDKKELMDEKNIYKEVADLSHHVIISGFGRVGRMVGKLLEAEHVRYVAIDADPDVVRDARLDGFPVYRGDASQLKILKTLAIDRASSVIFTVDNEITMKKGVKTIREHYADLPIIVRTPDLANAEKLRALGVTSVVPETYETGLQLGGAVLKSVGISEYEVSRIKNLFRAGNYTMVKGSGLRDNEDEESHSHSLS